MDKNSRTVCKDCIRCLCSETSEKNCTRAQSYDVGYKDAINKACEWLKSNNAFCYAGQYNNNEISEKDFRKAMEG